MGSGIEAGVWRLEFGNEGREEGSVSLELREFMYVKERQRV